MNLKGTLVLCAGLAIGVLAPEILKAEDAKSGAQPENTASLEQAVERVTARPRPLAFYYFDDDTKRAEELLLRVPCGGACVNDTLVHFAQEQLPFGGLGQSGSGAYHGEAGFETFSHLRSVLVASRHSAARSFMTPPFGPVIDTALEFLVRGLRRLR